MTISAWRQSLRKKEVSALELVNEHLLRLEKTEPFVHAYLEVTSERARSEARRVDEARASGEDLGPLAGLPLAIARPQVPHVLLDSNLKKTRFIWR